MRRRVIPILFVAVMVLPVAVLGILRYRQTQAAYTQATQARLQSIANLTATTLKERLDRLRDLGLAQSLRTKTREFVLKGEWDAAIGALKSVPSDFPFFDRIYITDPAGTEMADWPVKAGARGKNFAHRDWYKGVSRNWTPYVSEAYVRASEPYYKVIAIAAPMKRFGRESSNRKEDVIAILVLQVKLDVLLEWASKVEAGPGGGAAFIDQNAHWAAHPRIPPQGDLKSALDFPATARVLAGGRGVETIRDPLSREDNVAAFEPVAGYGWGAIVQQPVREAFAPLSAQIRMIVWGYSFLALFNAGLASLVLHSLSRRRKAESLLTIRHSVVQALALAQNLPQAIQGALKAICENLGVELGVFWDVDSTGTFLRFSQAWHPKNAFPNFMGMTRQAQFKRGEGLPGRVWDSVGPAWIVKLSRDGNFPRNPAALKDGLSSGFCFPICLEKRVLGVVEFFSVKPRKPDADLMRMVEEIGHQVGQFIHHKRAEEALKQMKNEFVSTVSHELRTPLTSIRGSLGLVLGGKAGEVPEKAVSLLGIASNNCERLVRLINDILDIEKIESGKMEFKIGRLDLIPVMEQAVEANRAYADQFQVKLEIRKAAGPVWVYADADKMTQVITNLLSNAIKFSPPGSTVTASLELAGDKARLEVTDRGPGIPEEFKARIFQKFAQADSSDTRRKGGTGLGLSISQAIIEKHGGRIGFESQPGQTVFYFELAAVRVPEAQSAIPAGAPRILICEDDLDVAHLLERILGDAGFATSAARNASEAKELLKRGGYAAMTLDILLPDQDGISLLKELRQTAAAQGLPVVVVSAKAAAARKESGNLIANVADWLDKPIDPQRLIAAAQRASRAGFGELPLILHVEDDPDTRRVVREILSEAARVEAATSLKEAREALALRDYSLALLDIELPDGLGLELLPLLGRRDKPIPVVIFSAHETDGTVAEQVTQALIKSKTTNEELLGVVSAFLPPKN